MRLTATVLGLFWAILFNQIICSYIGGTIIIPASEPLIKIAYILAIVIILGYFMLTLLPNWDKTFSYIRELWKSITQPGKSSSKLPKRLPSIILSIVGSIIKLVTSALVLLGLLIGMLFTGKWLFSIDPLKVSGYHIFLASLVFILFMISYTRAIIEEEKE